MPIDPEEISAAQLPRTSFGGYKREPTDELLNQVAWDYRKLADREAKLAQRVDELEDRVAELDELNDELGTQLARRRDPQETTQTLVAAAQRAARELRESARIDCEAMIRAARRRAEQIEAEARDHLSSTVADLEAAELLRNEVGRQLRTALDALFNRPDGASSPLVRDTDGAVPDTRPARSA